MEEIQAAGTREVESLKLDEMISCASWPNVRKHGFELDETDKKRVKDEPMYKSLERTDGKESSVSNERSYRRHLSEVRELRESRRRFLAAVKASYRNQFRHGLLSREVSERSERALRKTSIFAMNPAKWLQTATSTTELTHSIRLARTFCSCFIKNAKMHLASLGAGASLFGKSDRKDDRQRLRND